jgi:hypothetical protein
VARVEPVGDKLLTTYLNDHLAGSVMALELLDHLAGRQEGNDRALLAGLRSEIQEDQDLLKRLLHELGAKESPVRKVAAWLTEKLGQAKLQFDDSGSGDLQALEALETLALGIQGKLALWRALQAVQDKVPQLSTVDYPRLQARALDQFSRVDRLRLQAARRALIA